MEELNMHPIFIKEMNWLQNNNSIIQLTQHQQIFPINPKHNNLESSNNINDTLPMNNIWIVGDLNYLNATQHKLDSLNKQIEKIFYYQTYNRDPY